MVAAKDSYVACDMNESMETDEPTKFCNGRLWVIMI